MLHRHYPIVPHPLEDAPRGALRPETPPFQKRKLNQMALSPKDIRQAAKNIQGKIVRTHCVPSKTLSEITGADLILKFENLQFTGSFKERGALNKLLSLCLI
jgi:tryptophan synthase beta subunit